MQHLFNEDERYTEIGHDLSYEADKLLAPLIRKYAVEMGCSLRDINVILFNVCNDIVLEYLIAKNKKT